MRAPRLGWYGDDFTGATDTLGVLAQASLRAMLFMGVPQAAQQAAAREALGGELDAVGIAGASRSMAPEAMRAELEPVGRFFASQQCRVLHYKVCSTFDSAPHVGSIGTAIDVLRQHVRSAFVPIVGGQPSLGRYCAFSNLFAAAGAGGAVERIDRHPTMRCHPVTPMAEADLRRHLGLQGLATIAAMHYPVYAMAPAAQRDALLAMLASHADAVLMDLAAPDQLAPIGRLIWEQAVHAPLLAVGSSGVAQALVAHWGEVGELPRHADMRSGNALRGAEGEAGELPRHTDMRSGNALRDAEGPVFAFAGSLSPVTARQVRAARSYETVHVDAGDLLHAHEAGAGARREVLAMLAAGRHVLAYTAPSGGAATDTAKASALGQATAAFVKDIVLEHARGGTPLRRVGIAGGDTSSLAVKALGGWGLSYRGSLGAGVTVSSLHSADPALHSLELMLKGGQMGGDDVFERLVCP